MHTNKCLLFIIFFCVSCAGNQEGSKSATNDATINEINDSLEVADEYSGTYSYIHERSGKENFIMIRKQASGYEIKSGEQPYLPAAQDGDRLIVTSGLGANADDKGNIVMNIPSTLIFFKENNQYKAMIAIPNMDTVRLELTKR